MSDRKNQGRVFWGLLLIFLGVLFLLDQMGRLDFGELAGRYWPVLFILIGVSILLSNNFRNVGSAVFFILFGTFFLLLRLRVFDLALRYVWPLALIAAGLWVLLRPALHPDRKKAPEMLHADDLAINQVFSGEVHKVESQSFRGGKADVVLGSAEIDLRGAKLAGDQATLVLSVVLGGITVFVPREWQVVLRGTPVLGSIENHKPAAEGAASATLTLQGSAVLGSIEVKG